MAFPKSYKLINYTWTIEDAEQAVIDSEMINQGPPGNYTGYCSLRDLKVVVCANAGKQEKPRVLLHEILHSFFKGNSTLLSFEDEEKVVTLFEDRMVDLIKNNPKLIKYFMENL